MVDKIIGYLADSLKLRLQHDGMSMKDIQQPLRLRLSGVRWNCVAILLLNKIEMNLLMNRVCHFHIRITLDWHIIETSLLNRSNWFWWKQIEHWSGSALCGEMSLLDDNLNLFLFAKFYEILTVQQNLLCAFHNIIKSGTLFRFATIFQFHIIHSISAFWRRFYAKTWRCSKAVAFWALLRDYYNTV